jgi:transcription elongation factor/antiterminator RfaH
LLQTLSQRDLVVAPPSVFSTDGPVRSRLYHKLRVLIPYSLGSLHLGNHVDANGALGSRWYLALTQAGKESTAEHHLRQQGLRVFLPRRQRTIRHARRLRLVNAPAFPRYIFVRLDLGKDQWRSVNGTRGVSTLVMAHERPIVVPVGVVETLLDSSDEGGCLRFTSRLRAGQNVRLVAGPFAESLGVLESLDDHGRVQVLLAIMGGGVRVKLSEEWVQPTQ